MMKPLALLVLLISLTAGCAINRIERLNDRTDTFNRNIRWGSLAAASSFIAEENRKTLLEKLAKDLNENRIVDYSVVDLGLDRDKRKGSVLVEFSYYGISDQNLRYRKEMQLWQWDSRKMNWFLLEAREIPVKGH